MHDLDKIKFIGLTLADGNTGDFEIEIDYIGLLYDANLNEEFVYELYKVPIHKIYDWMLFHTTANGNSSVGVANTSVAEK